MHTPLSLVFVAAVLFGQALAAYAPKKVGEVVLAKPSAYVDMSDAGNKYGYDQLHPHIVTDIIDPGKLYRVVQVTDNQQVATALGGQPALPLAGLNGNAPNDVKGFVALKYYDLKPAQMRAGDFKPVSDATLASIKAHNPIGPVKDEGAGYPYFQG